MVAASRRGALLTALLLLALPVGAHAGELHLTPNGAHPDVAVDASGQAHIVWNESGSDGSGDIVHYCSLARGASTCAGQQAFDRPGTDFGGPRVLLGSTPGQVLLLTNRCCASVPTSEAEPGAGRHTAEPLWLYSSSDGGSTFGPAAVIGTNSPAGGAILGPGPAAVSTISNGGTNSTTGQLEGNEFQTEPLNGFTSAEAPVGAGGPGQPTSEYNGTVGLINNQTPIVAGSTLGEVFVRVGTSGASNYDSLAGWGPPVSLGQGTEPVLASGPRGAYLMERTSAGGHAAFVVRRFEGGAFGAPVAISEPDPGPAHYLYEDPTGALDAVWTSRNGVEYRYSTDGVHWSPMQLLVPAREDEAVYNLRLGACAPGDGFAVWDHNGGGGVQATPLGSNASCAAPPGSGCTTTVSFGQVQALAQSGCFSHRGSSFQTSGPVTVNGLSLTPAGASGAALAGRGARTASSGTITIDPSAHTLTSSGAVSIKVGSIELGHARLDWSLPAKGGPIDVGDGSGNPVALDVGALSQKLLGLPIVGTVTPELTAGQAVVHVNLQLPSPIGSILGGPLTFNEIALRVSNGSFGINLGFGFKLKLPEVSLGIATIAPFEIAYTGSPEVLTGNVGLKLPVGGTVKASIAFQQGSFVDLAADYQPAPPILLAGAPPSAVFLSDVNLHAHKLTNCQNPTEIAGGIGLSGGPPVLGRGIVGISGQASYKFPEASCNLPGVFRLEGNGTLAGFPIASAYLQYVTSGQFTFGGGASISLGQGEQSSSLGVNVGGGIDFGERSFFLEGQGGVGSLEGQPLLGATAIISNIGVGVCGYVVGIGAGFEYHWGGAFVPQFLVCNVSGLKPAAFSSSLRARSATAGFHLAGRKAFEVVAVTGSAGPPAVLLSGPNGVQITTPPAGQNATAPADDVLAVPSQKRTYIKLIDPPAGSWTVAAQAGSTPITAVATAEPLPSPSVRAHLHRLRAGRFALSYSIRPIPGQTMTFIERAGASAHPIARARGTHGQVRFRSAPGAGGRRTIVALVEQAGLPRDSISVATFTAPAPATPSGAADLRLRRGHGALLITWGRSRGAARYVVGIRLHDGRELERVVSGHRLAIAAVPGIDSGEVRVAGLGADGRPGAVALARLAAHPNRPCSERRALAPRCEHHRPPRGHRQRAHRRKL
jgi:hypothetical protein